MPRIRIALSSLSAGAAACVALIAAGVTPSAAAPASDTQGFVDSTARCAAPATAVAFGYTASSRLAICKSADGDYTYRGVRVRDGARLILPAESAGNGVYTADNDGVTYTVSADDLVVSAGSTVLREEPMLDFQGAAGSPASTGPGAGPASPTPTSTVPLGPPLPAEVGGSES